MGINISYGSFSFTGVYATPLIDLNKEIKRSSAGYIIGVTDKISLKGTLFHGTGIAGGSGSWQALTNQANSLRNAFSSDYSSLKIQCDANAPIYQSPANSTRVDSISLENNKDDYWFQAIDYTIELSVFNTGYMNYMTDSGYYISNFQDSYSITTNENNFYYLSNNFTKNFKPYSLSTEYLPSYTITRNISANGISTSGRDGFSNAEQFISGLYRDSTSLASMLSNLSVTNKTVSVTKDFTEGLYRITENYLAISGATSGWLDTFNINTDVDEQMLRSVSIQGVVQGYHTVTGIDTTYASIETQSSNTSGIAYINATGAFAAHVAPNIYARALQVLFPSGAFSGIFRSYGTSNLNPQPISASIEYSPKDGQVKYNYTFNSRPLSLVTGAISESLSFEDSLSTRTYHLQDIYYRMPLPQDIGTYSVPSRKVSYEATFQRPLTGTLPTSTYQSIKTIMDQFNPNKLTPLSSNTVIGPGYFSWLIEDTENYDIINGKFSKTLGWQYQKGYFPNGY